MSYPWQLVEYLCIQSDRQCIVGVRQTYDGQTQRSLRLRIRYEHFNGQPNCTFDGQTIRSFSDGQTTNSLDGKANSGGFFEEFDFTFNRCFDECDLT
jgi:hypothetical protein